MVRSTPATWVSALQRTALFAWLAIPVLGLMAQHAAGRIVWTVAVASLPLFIVLVGYHRWRMICPLAWFNQLPARLRRPGHRRMPAWVEQRYYYIPLTVFTLGLWLRLIWTNGDGYAIALFFLGLSAVAVVFGAITTGKTWCNYLCPLSFIEKIYTEPTGLRRTENSQCSPCTACKKACPDINQENAYWKEIDLPSKRLAYFAYPGLVFGFYFYYFLQSGTWDYYFGGSWTDEPGVIWRAFLPGFDAATDGFFFLPVVPRAAAALITLVGCAAVSWVIFTRVVTPGINWWLPRAQASIDKRNAVFALAAFTAFVTFYSFAGQPTLRKVDWLPPYVAVVTICVATLTLVRRFVRTPELFAEQSVARNLLKLPTMNYAELLQAYRDSVRESIAEGLVTRADVQRLTALRDRLRIRPTDHERVMRELATESAIDEVQTRRRVQEIDQTLAALRHDPSPAAQFLGELLASQRRRVLQRSAAVLGSAPDQVVMPELNGASASLDVCLRPHLRDGDPYVRAAAVAVWREHATFDPEILRPLEDDEDELVREVARPSAAPGTLERMLTLRNIEMFQRMDPISLAALARASAYERFAPGENLCVEGEKGEDVLVLVSGEADVFQGRGEYAHFVRKQRPGDVIGEMAALEPAPRSATVRAVNDGAIALRLKGTLFCEAVSTDRGVARGVIQTLVRRLRTAARDLNAEGNHS